MDPGAKDKIALMADNARSVCILISAGGPGQYRPLHQLVSQSIIIILIIIILNVCILVFVLCLKAVGSIFTIQNGRKAGPCASYSVAMACMT